MILLFSILYFFKFNLTLLFCLISAILIIIDFFTYSGIKISLLNKPKIFRYVFKSIFWALSLPVYLLLIRAFFIHKWLRNSNDIIHIYYLSNYISIIYVPKILISIFYLLQIVLNHLNHSLFNCKILKKCICKYILKDNHLLKIGFLFSFLIIIILTYGYSIGRFHFQVINKQLSFNDLPTSFDKLKIVQISDLHISTFNGNEDKVNKIVSLINKQNPDLVFFTGDLINNFAEELETFYPLLKKVNANIGKYAILGNHDYSDYYRWKDEKEREENHKLLLSYIDSAGFKLLLNENIPIIRNNDTIFIAGTENWGHLPYRQTGNLAKAIRGTNKNSFIILLTHDPTFWVEHVKGQKNIKITFSGHTHGMQVGMHIGKFEWTPFHFKYNTWAGLYSENGQLLYVNRGLGGGLYTGRFGIWPEISVFVFEKKKN